MKTFQKGPNNPVGPTSLEELSNVNHENIKPSPQTLNVCFFNAFSISNKVPLLNQFVKNTKYKYDIIFIVETWLNIKDLDSHVCPDEYQIIRKDRSNETKSRGGGVLALYKNGLNVIDVTNNYGDTMEHITIDVLMKSTVHRKYRFCCCYFPPWLVKQQIEANCIYLNKYLNPNPTFLLGDFNKPGINWSNMTACLPLEEPFLNFCIEASLYQHIHSATYKTGSTLDLILTNLAATNIMLSSQVLAPFSGTCDHNLITFNVACQPRTNTQQSIPKLCYKKGNYSKINDILSNICWDTYIRPYTDLQTSYDNFIELIRKLIMENTPTATNRKLSRLPPGIRKLSKRKKKLYQLVKKDPTLKEEYKKLSKLYDREVNLWFENKEKQLCNNPNVSTFYGYCNRKLKIRREIPPLKLEDGTFITEDQNKANYFNNVFHKVFIKDNGKSLSLPRKTNIFLTDINCSEQMIMAALTKLSPKVSNTPEEVPAFVVKSIAPNITCYLKHIFNQSLQTGVLPWQWRTAKVCPIFKNKGSQSMAEDWRPISLTSPFCRVLETVVKDKILSHVYENLLIAENQHGFLPGRTTTTQLIKALDNWTTAYDNKETTHVVYTDFAKAFDKVSHDKLLEVLQSYGIEGNLLRWVKMFLKDRNQRVMINGVLSSSKRVSSGVPQGSVLGPLLFILYIEDMKNCTVNRCELSLFADDSKLHSTETDSLQETLYNLNIFINQRQLALAADKCKHMCISRKETNSSFTIDDVPIATFEEAVDLGVLVSSNLKWGSHIAAIKTKAFVRCYQILKSFATKNIWVLKKIYITYIRPLLEYNSVVWNPHLVKDVKDLESVQRFFLKKACRRCNMPKSTYSERLYWLGLESLEYRRLKFDLIFVFKIVQNLIDLKFNHLFELISTPYQLRRHQYNFKTNRCNSNVRKFFFSNRVVPIWNKLPDEIVNSKSVAEFKRNIEKVDLRQYTTLVF